MSNYKKANDWEKGINDNNIKLSSNERLILAKIKDDALLLDKKEYVEKKKKKKRPKKRGEYKITHNYLTVTINPKECNISDLHDIIDIINKKKWVNLICYSFEQRGETTIDKGVGKHIHLILSKPDELERSTPTCIRRLLYNSLKEYFDSNTDKIIKVKKVNNVGKTKYEEYMKGDKDESKLRRVEIDNIWRKENNLNKIYYIDNESINNGESLSSDDDTDNDTDIIEELKNQLNDKDNIINELYKQIQHLKNISIKSNELNIKLMEQIKEHDTKVDKNKLSFNFADSDTE
ncbi:hypothetical protein Klosneuvirus_12_6 [Klosneuvirus KNV1]|uniref:Uncharacterized protein n=1 Tax=Klosneuvirus KNV1 TaxID=1977640 RepID=A0A1V0SLM7_9VIRU|nr:hypothetical protein Klosneuvirus_12_6 [Klosneuvirus KNV1]